MGYFYFDESIHERGGFIIGAYVYAERDLTQEIYDRIRSVGLAAGSDEFKSGAHMATDAKQRQLRTSLLSFFHWGFGDPRIGLVVIPFDRRQDLGAEALIGLDKIVRANKLAGKTHSVYFDEGISKPDTTVPSCDLHFDQDSRVVAGIQLADLVAHTLSEILLEEQGVISKTVKAGPGSGYDPDLDIKIGFELWAHIRWHFFTQDEPNIDADNGFKLDVAPYALHIADSCVSKLASAANARFSSTYVGCMH